MLWAASVGLGRRMVRAVAGRGPRRYREADLPDPLPEEAEMVELEPRHQALLDLWGGDAVPLQVEEVAEEARRAENPADQVCKSFILFNISLV
jgi:hypothetical protein